MSRAVEKRVTELFNAHDILYVSDLNPVTAAEKLDVTLCFFDETSEAIVYGDRKFIFLNDTLHKNDAWYQFCHELAHVEMHYGNQTSYLHTVMDSFISYQEMKADFFALYACAPTHILNNYEVYRMDHFKAMRFLCNECSMSEYHARKRLDAYTRLQFDQKGIVSI